MDHRNGQKGEQRHVWGNHHHPNPNHRNGGDQLQDLIGTTVEKTLELIDVVVENGEQATTTVVLKKRQLKLLQMVVGLEAQAVLGALSQVAPKNVVQILKDRLRSPNQKRKESEHPQLIRHRLDAIASKQ